MSLDTINEVDAVGIDRQSEVVVLTIADSWDWANEGEHLQALQGKLNAYFAFVESGEIYSVYPNAAGKSIRIEVVGRYELPAAAVAFLKKASVAGAQLGLTIHHRVH
jgi:hypothetical protein